MKKMTFFNIVLILLPLIVVAQDDLSIKLYDIQNNEPISFATVEFVGTKRGVVADYYGFFRLPLELRESIKELRITAIGYESLLIETSRLNPNQLNAFRMTPKVESLDTVVLEVSKKKTTTSNKGAKSLGDARSMFASEIVDKAIKSIPLNLSTKPHSYIGYYRDYQFMDNEYFNLNEGVIEHFDSGIDTNLLADSRNQDAFYLQKTNDEFNKNEELAKNYDNESKYIKNARLMGFGGNEFTILKMHNPIRNYKLNTFSYVYQMNRDFISNHIFTKGKVEFLEDEPIITIHFKTEVKKDNGPGARNKIGQTPYYSSTGRSKDSYTSRVSPDFPAWGQIAISMLDFSIHEFKYTLYNESENKVMFNIVLEYRRVKDKMYLNFHSFNNGFLSGGKDIFKEERIVYLKDKNTFEVQFNRPIDMKTLKKRNFKFYLKNRRLPIDDLKIKDTKTITLVLPNYEQSAQELENEDVSDLKVVIKGLKDVDGMKIYKEYPAIAHQFREFFVQQINTNENLDMSLNVIPKTRPLTVAPVNEIMETSVFILNSPLQKRELQTRRDLNKTVRFNEK